MLLQFTRFVVPHSSANTINKCFSLNELGNFQYFINKTKIPIWGSRPYLLRFLYWVASLSYSHLAPPALLSHLTGKIIQNPWENKCTYILYYKGRWKGLGMGASKSKREGKPRKIVLSCPSLMFQVLNFGFPFIRKLWLLFSHGPLGQVIA